MRKLPADGHVGEWLVDEVRVIVEERGEFEPKILKRYGQNTNELGEKVLGMSCARSWTTCATRYLGLMARNNAAPLCGSPNDPMPQAILCKAEVASPRAVTSARG